MDQEQEKRENNTPFEVLGKSKGNNGVLVRWLGHIQVWQRDPHALTSHQGSDFTVTSNFIWASNLTRTCSLTVSVTAAHLPWEA